MTLPGRSHDILETLIIESATRSITLPSALCAVCSRTLPMTGVAIVLQSTAGLDRIVAATDGLTAAVRWPVFAPAAATVGVAATFAFPVQVGGIRLGVLDLYRDTTGGLLNGV